MVQKYSQRLCFVINLNLFLLNVHFKERETSAHGMFCVCLFKYELPPKDMQKKQCCHQYALA
jgi:hypothetical protein